MSGGADCVMKRVSQNQHCYSEICIDCCTGGFACSLGNYRDNQHSTYWPGVFEGNDNVSISLFLSSSSPSIVSSVAERQGVPTQDSRAARSEGADSCWNDPGLVLLQTGVKEGVTLVSGRAALPPTGLEVAAVSGLQQSVRVLEVPDLELEHADSTYSLRKKGWEGDISMLLLIIFIGWRTALKSRGSLSRMSTEDKFPFIP